MYQWLNKLLRGHKCSHYSLQLVIPNHKQVKKNVVVLDLPKILKQVCSSDEPTRKRTKKL